MVGAQAHERRGLSSREKPGPRLLSGTWSPGLAGQKEQNWSAVPPTAENSGWDKGWDKGLGALPYHVEQSMGFTAEYTGCVVEGRLHTSKVP